MVRATSRVASKQTRLKLGATHCQSFGVTIEIPAKDFLDDAFVRALPIKDAAKIFNEGGPFFSVCHPKSKQIDYQADVHIHKLRRKQKAATVTVHVDLRPTTRMRERREKPPFAEDIFEWMSQFIAGSASIKLFERCEFLFPTREFQSVFLLPLRLSGGLNYTGHPLFEGSQMMGVRIMPRPNQIGLTSVFQELVSRKGILVFLARTTDTSLTKLLTVESDVAILYNIAKHCVRPRGTENDD